MFNKHRVEEDLERIRKANLPSDVPVSITIEPATAEEKIGFKDVLAMIIAVFSLTLPYVLIFIGVMAVVVYAFILLAR